MKGNIFFSLTLQYLQSDSFIWWCLWITEQAVGVNSVKKIRRWYISDYGWKGNLIVYLRGSKNQNSFARQKNSGLLHSIFQKYIISILLFPMTVTKLQLALTSGWIFFAQIFYISGKKRLKRKSGFLATDTGETFVPALKVSSRPICREASEHSVWKIYGGCHTTLSFFTFLILSLLLTVGKSSF